MPLARTAVAVAALLSVLAAPAAAQPFQLTPTGARPHVAVDGSGTGHFVWNQPSAEGSDVTVYCQVPRGATTCSRFQNLIPAGEKLFDPGSGPRVLLAGDGRIVVVAPRCCSQVWRFVSSDGGQTFDSRLIGDLAGTSDWTAVLGPGERVSLATSGDYQAAPLDGSTTAKAELLDGSVHGTGLTLVDPSTPLVVSTPSGERELAWRRYLGSGDLNAASNWSPAQPVGPGTNPHLVSGPRGTYLFYEAGSESNAAYVARRWNGGGFDPPLSTVIAPGGSQRQPAFHQDPTGTFHAVWGSNETMPQRLLYSSSKDAVTWSEPREIAPYREAGYFHNRIAAAAEADGFAASDENAPGIVEAAPLAPQPAAPERPDDPSCRTRAEFRPVEVVLPEGCFKQVAGRLETSGEVKVNGLLVEPRAGATVVIDPAKRRISSRGVTTVRAGIIPVQAGALDWTIPNQAKVRVDSSIWTTPAGSCSGSPSPETRRSTSTRAPPRSPPTWGCRSSSAA